MGLPALLDQYGYALIFLGTMVEGETILMLGGNFAHRGYLELGTVIVTAFAGAVCGDQLFFYIGRHHAKGLLRIALPVALGLTNMNAKRFLWLNLASAAVWSSVFAVVGFGASRVFSALVDDLQRHEKWIAAVLLLITVVALIWHLGRPQRARQ
jgi:membrane protein DedA with SNARE-associated domain